MGLIKAAIIIGAGSYALNKYKQSITLLSSPSDPPTMLTKPPGLAKDITPAAATTTAAMQMHHKMQTSL
jgi:hypothetical protein